MNMFDELHVATSSSVHFMEVSPPRFFASSSSLLRLLGASRRQTIENICTLTTDNKYIHAAPSFIIPIHMSLGSWGSISNKLSIFFCMGRSHPNARRRNSSLFLVYISVVPFLELCFFPSPYLCPFAKHKFVAISQEWICRVRSERNKHTGGS